MLWCDIKYINMLGHRLRNFKRRSQYLWNMSCPICGDSKTRRHAARGFVYRYRNSDHLNYCCHKCGAGMTLKNFIALIDPGLHKEMQLEYFKPPENESPIIHQERPVFDKSINPLKGLVKISDLPSGHLCRQYVSDRLIPGHLWDDLYFTPSFFTWAGAVLPGRYKVPKDIRDDEPRLIIPMRNLKGELTALQGRVLKGDGPKYISIALSVDEPHIWGLDKIDPNKTIYAFEGPIDAMFIPNAIACAGGDLSSDLLQLPIPRERFVVIYDNEPRKKNEIRGKIVNLTAVKIEQAIQRGFAVCIWPELAEKDVNDMVKKNIKYGLPAACQYVFSRINEGIYSGPNAMLALMRWNKIKQEMRSGKRSANS